MALPPGASLAWATSLCTSDGNTNNLGHPLRNHGKGWGLLWSFTGRFYEKCRGVSVGAGVGLSGEGTLASPSSLSWLYTPLTPRRRQRPPPPHHPPPPLQNSKTYQIPRSPWTQTQCAVSE